MGDFCRKLIGTLFKASLLTTINRIIKEECTWELQKALHDDAGCWQQISPSKHHLHNFYVLRAVARHSIWLINGGSNVHMEECIE